MLRGSQVCSALQPPAAAWVWPSATPPQRWASRFAPLGAKMDQKKGSLSSLLHQTEK
ncbi:hypothetical protein SGRA_1146 [Saprospira grandis str. Lewin]|uniref:Uncharacterized protein n=1 Tax=Saprospira grandis (strain Lewin) TaxID=984262 RepID=H6L3Z9_SAPGL|nr:hypothetical protein SGRA_1146 [Saprospira grandis str. Lewin]